MTIPVLICDDSSFARKQMVRALPANWDIELHYAENGEEALTAIREGHGDILFLDLNMPILDGYGTLQAISKEDLPTMVIVVSGDIQPEAHREVKSLGAIDFIKKPTDKAKVKELLENYGILRPEDLLPIPNIDEIRKVAEEAEVDSESQPEGVTPSHMESYREVANVAMGRAGDLLARLLGVKVKMPIPNVNLLAISELHMVLKAAADQKSFSAICQGYTGSGIAGEALILFYDSSFQDLADLMNYKSALDDASERELLVDLSNILIGAFLKGLSDQLNVGFSQSHPKLLGQHIKVSDLLSNRAREWENILAIEINYVVEAHNIQCDLLLLLTEDSLQTLNNKISFLLDDDT
jgi:chemotaxis protein CheY-P-specific phosphatase CheC/ActR/RegA family two-component response regulator